MHRYKSILGAPARAACAVVLLCFIESCEDSTRITSTEQPNNNPSAIITYYSPPATQFEMFVDDSIEFSVETGSKSATVEFMLDGETVSNKSSWVFVPAAAGVSTIVARATRGAGVETVEWTVGTFERNAPPIEITAARASETVPTEIVCEWTAAAGTRGDRLVRYWIRTLDRPILTESDWDQATTRATPGPEDPGVTMHWELSGFSPNEAVYVAVRGVDAYANFTKIGASMPVTAVGGHLQGRVLNALTLDPIANVSIRFPGQEVVSAADGTFELADLPAHDGTLIFQDESAAGVIGDYYDFVDWYRPRLGDSQDFYLLPNIPTGTPYYPDFRNMYILFTSVRGIPVGNNTNRWAIPVDVYVPPYSANGLDFREMILYVLDSMEALLGRDLFTIVDAPPDHGVTCYYKTDINSDNYKVDEFDENYYPYRARIEFRTSYTSAAPTHLERVARHEFGHMLGLNHSNDPTHLMVGGVFPGVINFSDIETTMLTVFYNLPQGFPAHGFQPE